MEKIAYTQEEIESIIDASIKAYEEEKDADEARRRKTHTEISFLIPNGEAEMVREVFGSVLNAMAFMKMKERAKRRLEEERRRIAAEAKTKAAEAEAKAAEMAKAEAISEALRQFAEAKAMMRSARGEEETIESETARAESEAEAAAEWEKKWDGILGGLKGKRK